MDLRQARRNRRIHRLAQPARPQVQSLEPRRMLAVGSPTGFGAHATGGTGGPTVTVTTAADFAKYATQTGPYTIQLQGTLDIGDVRVTSNKTIVGLGNNATLKGDLGLYGVSNVIVQNLFITNPSDAGEGDGITIKDGTLDVWVDHCTFFDTPDGLLDITRESDFVTASWNKFYYTKADGHNFAMLIGSSDSATDDLGKLHVTLHHNWWSSLVVERMPSVRYGRVHLYNNYYDAAGNNYGVRSRIEAEVLIQNNVFENVDDPYYIYVTDGKGGKIKASGNLLINTSGLVDDGNDTVFTPPYVYTLDQASDVKAKVVGGAGAGRLSSTPTVVAPAGLAAAALSSSQIKLTWQDKSSNESGFKLERSTDGKNFTQIYRGTVANQTSFTDSGRAGNVTYYYRVRAYIAGTTDSGYSNTASARTSSTVITPLPAHWWKLDETSGTTAADAVGQVNGRLINMESGDWVSGKVGRGLSFDGVNEQVDLGNNLNQTRNFTIAAWIKPSKVTGVLGIFGKITDAHNKQYLLTLNGNKLSFEYERSGNNWSLQGGAIQANVWQHVAVTIDSALKVTLYINGSAVASATAPAETISSTRSAYLGRWGGTYTTGYFAGVMDDVRFYATALTAAQIARVL